MRCFRVFSSPRPFYGSRAASAVGMGLVVGGIFCASSPAARATSAIYQVTVQTGGLNGLGIFGLDFLLQNGSVTNPLRATIQNVRMTGGTLIGTGGTTAGSQPVTGNLGASLLLSTTNGGDFGEFAQNFTVNSNSGKIIFDLSLSSNALQASALDPDYFMFSIQDSTGTPLFTNAPDNTSLLFAQFDRTSPRAQTFSSGSPNVSVQAVAAPEPGSAALIWPVGFFGAVFLLKQRGGIKTGAMAAHKTGFCVLK